MECRSPVRYRRGNFHFYYNYQRYYDPSTGRYIQTDPIGFDAGDANLYHYVFNNPTGLTDSQGLFLDVLLDLGFIFKGVMCLAVCPSFDNFMALALDTAGAVLTFVTGLGEMYKAEKLSAYMAELRKVLGKADEAIEAAARELMMRSKKSVRWRIAEPVEQRRPPRRMSLSLSRVSLPERRFRQKKAKNQSRTSRLATGFCRVTNRPEKWLTAKSSEPT